jgi:hypothetical protein
MILTFLAGLANAGAIDTLRSRDAVACSALGDANPALRDELVALTDPATLPPAVPIRAANCLIDLYGADPIALGAVTGWMTDPERHGLALVVLGRLGDLDPLVATELARKALTVPDEGMKTRVASRLKKSSIAEVRALVPPSGG